MIAELGFVMCYIVAPAFANVLRDATIQLQLSNYATGCCISVVGGHGHS